MLHDQKFLSPWTAIDDGYDVLVQVLLTNTTRHHHFLNSHRIALL